MEPFAAPAANPLDPARIALSRCEVRVLERCSSTNEMLLGEPGFPRPVLLAAEAQTAGRGRRGRRWHSAPGSGLTFSLAIEVGRAPRELAGLSLVAGVACARALRALGAHSVRLKWPNDLVVNGAKLGGILVETRSGAGRTAAVIGVGLNCRRDGGLAGRLRRAVAFLEDQAGTLDRNLLLRALGESLLDALAQFEAQGLEPLREPWEAMHAHAGCRLRVRLADGHTVQGEARGLAPDGALQIQTRRGLLAVSTGRVVSARAA